MLDLIAARTRSPATGWLAHLGLEPLGNELRRPSPARALAGRRSAAQVGADGPAARGRRRQHLCQRGAAPRRHVAATPAGLSSAAERRRPAGRLHPRGAARGHRRRRLLACATTSSPTASWATSRATFASTTATGGRAAAAAADPAHRPGGQSHLLLRPLPALDRDSAGRCSAVVFNAARSLRRSTAGKARPEACDTA